MDALKNLYTQLGYAEISTYIQSGNVLFHSDEKDSQAIKSQIEKGIKYVFGFDVEVIVLKSVELKSIIENNPFRGNERIDIKNVYVTLLTTIPPQINIIDVYAKKGFGEEIIIKERVIYLYCPMGYGKTKLNNNFLERKLRVSATTRNWKTISTLCEMLTI